MQDRRIRAPPVVRAGDRPGVEIDFRRFGQSRMRLGVEVRVAEKRKRKLVGVNLEQIPQRIGLRRDLRAPNRSPQVGRNVPLQRTENIDGFR